MLSVQLLPHELGLEVTPCYNQTNSNWDKSSSNVATHKNWGLLRMYEGATRANWGSNGTTNQSGSIDVSNEGRNVDIVVVDGLIDPNHPEFSVNADGTGGSRVIQYNWYQHRPQVNGNSVGTYIYTPYTGNSIQQDRNNNHGAHVAGIIAGNTQGWARRANIYNIYPYASNPTALEIFDYIRYFHRSKPVNPITGVINPTIVNNSWGYIALPPYTGISSVTFRGITYNGPFTKPQLANFGIYVNASNEAQLSLRYSALDADVEDAIRDGIIVVGAAGNNYQSNDISTGVDYDNFASWVGAQYYYNRGISPGSSANGICVGAISALTNESKAIFSNCGPRVDVYAPGQNIMSSVNTTTSYGGVADVRNSLYSITKISGTSMASPQVAGILACALETYPNMKQTDAVNYITSYAKTNQISTTSGGPTDYTDLQGSNNRYSAFVTERSTTGFIFPKRNFKSRQTGGLLFPRTQIRRYGGRSENDV